MVHFPIAPEDKERIRLLADRSKRFADALDSKYRELVTALEETDGIPPRLADEAMSVSMAVDDMREHVEAMYHRVHTIVGQ